MRVLFLTASLNSFGGIQKYNKDFLEALAQNQVEVFVVELKPQSLFAKIAFVAKTLIKALRCKPDLIICSHINFSPLCYFLGKTFGAKYLVNAYGIEVWNIKSPSRVKALKAAHKIVSISNYTKKKLIEQFSELADKILILPPVIKSDKFFIKEKSQKLVQEYNLENKKVILTIARLCKQEKYKGYDKIIEALPIILKRFPETVYILAGGGDDVARIKNLVKELKLENNVILTGPLLENDLVDYYNLCDVFVMPSRGEGFGIVFMEALACGKTVVAGNQDASREPLLNGELGVLVNPDEVQTIAETIIKVFRKEINSRFLDSQFLRRKTTENFSFERFKAKLKELINQ